MTKKASAYQIEDNVPIPELRTRTRSDTALADTLNALEVGQSFVVTDKYDIHRVSELIVRLKRTTNKRFTTRQLAKGEPHGGKRVWRIEDAKDADSE